MKKCYLCQKEIKTDNGKFVKLTWINSFDRITLAHEECLADAKKLDSLGREGRLQLKQMFKRWNNWPWETLKPILESAEHVEQTNTEHELVIHILKPGHKKWLAEQYKEGK